MTTVANKQELLERLQHTFGVIMDLRSAQDLLSWDQNTYMPAGATAARGQQLATLGTLTHERVLEPSLREALKSLEGAYPDDSAEGAFLRLVRRDVERAAKVPPEFMERLTKLRSEAQGAWLEARAADDFSRFAPLLEQMMDMSRQQADYLGYDNHPYDALHELYEPGSSVAQVERVFEPLRDETVALLKKIAAAPAADDSVLHQPFDEAAQEAFGLEVVKGFGYDFTRGRLDRSAHPFAQGIHPDDVRITTRYNPNFLNSALFGTLHEAGHGMYEQGLPKAHARSPLGKSVSLAVHESQSRLWENLVGRSEGFWSYAYARLQERFPQLQDVPLDTFYRAINRVAPSLIRVEADEVTYNLHIMLRFELEKALLEGSLKVKDLPEAWNAKYEAYLGITPPSNAMGCMQDIHWAIGLVGYFPTYTLGNIMSVQLYEAALKAEPEIEVDMRNGRFERLLGWLRTNVHEQGARYMPNDLLLQATGSGLDSAPYIRYLNRKFGTLYGF